ncbi:MAG: hypothetical protein IJI98_02405 [Methanosphaera sp.]|nr:hypothetical protein [Methanosphaera sp.]
MNLKNILMIGLILIAAGSLITAVNAAENVNINGENLNVLDGFKAYESDVDTTHMDEDGLDVEDIDGTRVDNKITREYINSNGDKLELTVGVLNNGKPVQTLNAYGYTKKVINGKDGYYKTEMDDGRQQYKFQYIKDGKLVKIEAPNEDSISKVMT